MAYGDPMVFQTEELGTNVGFETAGTGGVAQGWTKTNGPTVTGATPTQDNAEQRSGSYCQKLLMTTSGSGYCTFHQMLTLPGPTNQDGKGHKGATYPVSVWAKRGASDKAEYLYIRVQEYSAADALLETDDSEDLVLTAAYQQRVLNYTISNAACAYLKLTIFCAVTGAQTAACFYLDDFSVTEKLTCNTNPVSEGSTYALPEAFERSINNSGYFQRNSSSVPKHTDGRLVFQDLWDNLKLLRSLWLWGKLLTWTPNLYNLPATMYVYFTGDCTPRRLQQNDALFELAINYQEQ